MNLRYVTYALLTLLLSSVMQAKTLTFYGNAADPDNGEALYQEVHRLTLNENNLPISEVVEYRSPTGDLLGKKTLTYDGLSRPDYQVSFKAREGQERVTATDNQIQIERDETVVLEVPDGPFAIDGGFHYFIQQHFEQLLDGDTVDFQFLSAGRGDFIPMAIKPTEQSASRITLELSLQNFFLSKLVRPIILTYDIAQRQLVSYDGLTNVPDGQGKLHTAIITYQYPDDMVSVALPDSRQH